MFAIAYVEFHHQLRRSLIGALASDAVVREHPRHLRRFRLTTRVPSA